MCQNRHRSFFLTRSPLVLPDTLGIQTTMALRRNDDVSVSVTGHADGAITGSVSGAASDVGDVVECFGRGVGYVIEEARLETGGGVYTSKCYECKRSLSTANQAFYRKFFLGSICAQAVLSAFCRRTESVVGSATDGGIFEIASPTTTTCAHRAATTRA